MRREVEVRYGVIDGEPVVYIPLTRGREAVVDADMWPPIAEEYGERWKYATDGKGNGYAMRDIRAEDGGRSMLTLGRAVMGAKPGTRVEAINGDPLDARQVNLRVLQPKKAREKRQEFAKQRRFGPNVHVQR